MGALGTGCIVLALFAGCVRSDTDACGDDVTCRAGTVCVHALAELYVCVPPDARGACERDGLSDGVECGAGGRCYDGSCVPIACGDRLVDPTEMCDDGNTVSTDGCSADCASDEQCGNRVVDPTNEVCDDGNAFSGDGCDVRCQPELPSWERIFQSSPPPFVDPAMAFDPLRGEAILFGDTTYATQTFRLNAAWTVAQTGQQPIGRTGGAMVYDVANERIVLYGGDNPSDPNSLEDTWLWDGTSWALVDVGSMGGRGRTGLAYDAHRKKVIMFGGARRRPVGLPTFLDETWEWDGTTWTQVQTAVHPSARADAAMAYDPVRGVTVLFGGVSTLSTTRSAETWEFDGTTWRLITPTVSPPALDGAQMVAYHGKMLMFGGSSTATGDVNDTWLYDGITWQKLADASNVIGARHNHALVYDSTRDRVVAFGGASLTGSDVIDSQTYVFDGDKWSAATFSIQSPGGLPLAVGDAGRGRAIVAIGATTYTLADDAWTTLAAAPGATPTFALTFDRAREVAVMFGGASSPGTFTFATKEWVEVTPRPSPSPEARSRASMTFDREREEVVLYGGVSSGPEIDDTWIWTGTAWVDRDTASLPGLRSGAALGYDPIRKQTILFGGSTSDDRTFAWDGTAWIEVGASVTASQRPLPRQDAAIVWNPTRGKLTMFGGSSPYVVSGLLDDTWEWTGTRWEQVAITGLRPERRARAGMVADTAGVGLYLFAGDQGSVTAGDLWHLSWSNTTPRDRCLDRRDSDDDGLVGCDDADCWARCHPLCEPGENCDAIATCGDGVAAQTETCRLCPEDTHACEVCGDVFCAPGEDCAVDCDPQ